MKEKHDVQLTDYGVYDGGIDQDYTIPESPTLKQLFDGFLDKPLEVTKTDKILKFKIIVRRTKTMTGTIHYQTVIGDELFKDTDTVKQIMVKLFEKIIYADCNIDHVVITVEGFIVEEIGE